MSSATLAKHLHTPLKTASTFLRNLNNQSLICRIAPDTYLYPRRMTDRAWRPSEFEILQALMSLAQSPYRLCGPSAFSLHGWDTQVSNCVHAYNQKISGVRSIASIRFTFIKVTRWPGADKMRAAPMVGMPSKARALVDGLDDWARFLTIPRIFRWISKEITDDPGLADDLVKAALDLATLGTRRRIGYLLDICGASEQHLLRLERSLNGTGSQLLLNPGAERQGPINKRWNLVINCEEELGLDP